MGNPYHDPGSETLLSASERAKTSGRTRCTQKSCYPIAGLGQQCCPAPKQDCISSLPLLLNHHDAKQEAVSPTSSKEKDLFLKTHSGESSGKGPRVKILCNSAWGYSDKKGVIYSVQSKAKKSVMRIEK